MLVTAISGDGSISEAIVTTDLVAETRGCKGSAAWRRRRSAAR